MTTTDWIRSGKNCSGPTPGLTKWKGIISGSIDASAASSTPYVVTVTASDPNLSASSSFQWMVTASNLAPVLTNPGNQANTAGDNVSLDLTASDADGDPLTYTATGLPAGISIDPSSGSITGTLANSAASTTPYTITVSASDGMASSSQSFTWSVAYVGVTNPGNQSNVDGDAVSLAMTGYDANNNSLTWTEIGLPSGLTINSSTGAITGTLSSTDDTSSPYTVTVTANDGTHSGNTTFTWTVAPLSLAAPGDQYSTEGQVTSLPLSANADGNPISYTAGDAVQRPYQVSCRDRLPLETIRKPIPRHCVCTS